MGETISARLPAATGERPVALGRYDVVGRLGRGGMGTVYEARDRERGTRVALKTLLALDAAAALQLKREFRTVSDLAHPNLVPVYELACDEGVWFFTMELVPGSDFRRWARGSPPVRELTAETRKVESFPAEAPTRSETDDALAGSPARRKGAPPVRRIEEIRAAMVDLVRGIVALHDAGLWHGDIKPGNVLVRDDGRVVVVDFGLARPVGVDRSSPNTTSGTPAYMSPEQLAGGDVGPRSDWYALGTMLYEMLTGRLPFAGTGTVVERYIEKTLRRPDAPCDVVAGLPLDLSDLCLRLLLPEPEHRPDGEELLALLAGRPLVRARAPRAAKTVFVGRARELETIARAYERTRAGIFAVVHVRGPSGIGKSAMVRSFLDSVRDVDGAEILSGRSYERESVPYKAFDGIIDELAARLVAMGPDVERLLPQWVGELAQVFPALSTVPSIAARVGFGTAREARELRRRAWSALRELLSALARKRRIVLFIDDLQWADTDSAGLLASFLAESRRSPLLMIATYREAEAEKRSALGEYFDLARGLAAAEDLTEISLSGLGPAEAEELARATLDAIEPGAGGDVRVRDLAHEAAGVPFLIEELARWVATKGDAAGAAPVSLDAAIAARIQSLPAAQRALVEVAAVADTPIEQSLVFDAAGLDADALPELLALRSASLLRWTGPSPSDLVSPYHDRIREVALATLEPGARRRRHLAIGRALRARHEAESSGQWMFDTVKHLRAAGDALSDPDERRAAAILHLAAGRAARKAAAFRLAFDSFEGGIALFSGAWDDDYDLAIGLHAGAAESAYLSAEWTVLAARVADVKAHAKTRMDQLIAWEVQIDGLIGRHDYAGAVDAAMEALALFDVRLPRHPVAAEVGAAAKVALDALIALGPDRLAALLDVDDPEVAAAMRIQVRVSPAAYFSEPLLLPILASNLIVTSIERGLSTATPYALALFGIVLNAMEMFPVSHAWGQLAVKLLDRWDDRSLEAATRHVVFNLVCPWMVPLATILAPLREVFDIGRRVGDLEYAAYAAHGWVHNSMYAGRPLEPLFREATELGAEMRTLGQLNAHHVHAPFEQLLKCWTGRSADPSRLDDAGFSEERALAAAAAEGSRSGILVLRFVMGLARFHFGAARDASACLEIARDYLDAGPSVWHVPILHQFAVLAGWRAWTDLGAAEREALRPRLEASVAALRTLAGHSPINFAHRVALVEGALHAIAGDDRAARACFERAAAEAAAGDWSGDTALAHELAAHTAPDERAARASRERARAAYAAWGAKAKADALAE